MTKLKKMIPTRDEHSDEKTVNYMGGVSFKLNPVETLKLFSASSMFMEPKYYQPGDKVSKRVATVDDLAEKFILIKPEASETSAKMTVRLINEALDYDFKATIELAAELREEYLIRVTPQVIMVIAATHNDRQKFDEENPGAFRELQARVMKRADEPACQLACWLWLHDGKKHGIPSILKRSWKDRIEKMSAYEVSKYKSADAGLINTIRICHAKGDVVSDLMTDGKIDIEEDEKTWENLRSSGKTFKEIYKTIKMPHMALLRNLRNFLKENGSDSSLIHDIIDYLKNGVKNGKQFPFRYYAAKQAVEECANAYVNDGLEECIDISAAELPKLKGRVMCLTDNSGSAWGAFTSEYGSNEIAVIDNISSVIAASKADEGYVGKFGDKLKIYPISKRNGLLTQAEKISQRRYDDVGGSTENGIWLFFKNAIEKKEWWDTIFVFSDQQAGHGGLYGEGDDYCIKSENFSCKRNGRYDNKFVDVLKLLERYRKTVNPKVNFFTIQTAGYTDAIIPEYIYRGAVLTGWTGKEVNFADKLIKQWDAIEENKI